MLMMRIIPLQQALRRNQRTRKLPTLLRFLSSRLQISEDELELVSLEESDGILERYRSKIKSSDSEKQFIFETREQVHAVLKMIFNNVHPDTIYLYSTPLCDSCGSVKLELRQFIDSAADLVELNSEAVYIISSNAENCIDLTRDTENSGDYGKAYYILTIKGKNYTSAID